MRKSSSSIAVLSSSLYHGDHPVSTMILIFPFSNPHRPSSIPVVIASILYGPRIGGTGLLMGLLASPSTPSFSYQVVIYSVPFVEKKHLLSDHRTGSPSSSGSPLTLCIVDP